MKDGDVFALIGAVIAAPHITDTIAFLLVILAFVSAIAIRIASK